MIEIKGNWFDGRISSGTAAVLKVYDDRSWRVLSINDGQIIQQGNLFQADVSPRLADTPRYITFSGDETLETDDNSNVDEALRLLKGNHWSLKVHFLESKLRYVLVSVVILIVVGFATTRYGVPAAAKLIAQCIPKNILYQAGEQSLAVFDKVFFKPSELDPVREKQLRHTLFSVVKDHADLRLEILFRKGGKIGANAFALPSGQIIITDEMVELVANDDELLAIVVHEIGHVAHNHGLRRLIQDSILSFAILSITGDASGVSELFLGLPVVLAELGYSRGFEVEADIFAVNYLEEHSIDPQHFANILVRASSINLAEGGESEDDSNQKWVNYFSTHPATEDRVKLISSKDR